MLTKSRYVFGAALASAALSLTQRAHAALVTNADFTFESDTIAVTGASVSFSADSGIGTAYGVHASTATVYSSPTGNGSPKSFSANHWAVGDYYQFSVPTTALSGIMVSFDQTGSGTGPDSFSLLYSSTGATPFVTYANYFLPSATVTSTGTAGTATASFASGTSNPGFTLSFDLSSITALNNDSSAVFELVDNSTAAYSSTAAVASTGTDRVDNFIVSGTAVPEPASLSLLTVASAAALRRRRK